MDLGRAASRVSEGIIVRGPSPDENLPHVLDGVPSSKRVAHPSAVDRDARAEMTPMVLRHIC
jgi:hypothetical protein